MSKREARSIAAAGVDIDAPRAKRRKEAPATNNPASDGKHAAETTGANGATQDPAASGTTPGEDRETVREKGLQLWTTLKDAVNKEGAIASFQFMRLPSKRQYPDYYVLIKHPIALEDIKNKLEAREYTSLEDVKHDFETCFRNAKRYNMKESQIFKDAKFLHKLAAKTYSRITGTKEVDGDGSDDEEKKKKPTLHRLLKTRLQKLVAKTDDSGRVLSDLFMELPSKKSWPIYYTLIKKPQCLQNIFNKLKRKEYPQPVDFANDVELVFSNALEFNQEHTQIWEDAVALREYFRKLMSDLPEPYTIPAYANSGEHPTKIKLRVPHAPAAQPQSIVAPAPSLPSSNSIVVRGYHAASTSTPVPPKKVTLPAATSRPANTVKSPSVTPVISPTPVPPSAQASSSLNVISPPAPAPITAAAPATAPQGQQPVHVATFRPTTFAYNHTGATNGAPYNAGAASQPPSLAPAPPKAHSISPAITSTSAVAAAPSALVHVPAVAVTRPSPPAVIQYAHPLQHAVVTTMPHCRRLVLDQAEGVRSWAMRLSASETAVLVSEVTFLGRPGGAEEDESSSDEELHRQEEEEEEEAEATPKKRGPGRPRKRGRPPKAVTKKAKVKVPETQLGPLQVKLNGTLLNAKEGDTWEVQVPYGMSTLELGEQGGMVWKVYLDRTTF
ncbi:Bromodomain-containing protein [Polyporus arcularius HHB13444]|uniref:Bromodomain-containing protein n=1 Tax=Polyporus arcularius HHB13444 TaxID=1314778 RepID=A0A5C3P423_9APHY|nr:Bromodomain-containing protein [Polyporus arcularius HHB13444]